MEKTSAKKNSKETKETKMGAKPASKADPKTETKKVEKAKVTKKAAPKRVAKQEREDGLDIATFDSYAIFKTGGKQYQAVAGRTIAIEKIAGEPGDSVEFDQVLLRKLDDNVEIGQPFLESKIKASIVKQSKGPKVIVFRFKRRKKYRVKKGHRQQLTVIRVEDI